MSKRILTFFLAVLMLVGSIVPVFAEEADVVIHEPVKAEGVDLGKREMVKENDVMGKTVAKEDVAPAEEVKTTETEATKLVKVTIRFVDPSGDEIAKALTKEYALGSEKIIKAPDIKGYIKKDDTKSFTVTEGLEVALVYEKIKADEAVAHDAKVETDTLDVADVRMAAPVRAEAVDASLYTFEGTVLTGLSDKGKAMVDAKVEAGEDLTITVPAKTDAGEDVTAIADNAFRELGANFTFEANDKLVSIGDHAFFKNKITSLDLSSMTNLAEVKDYAFAHNELNELVLPDSLKTIGAYAFRDNLLKELDTKNVVSLGEGAFSNNRLEKLVFGDALTTIGSHAFEQNALVEVEIGNNVTSFGKSVFGFNSRYVKINTKNPLIKNEKVYRGYGHVVNPVKITVKYVDAETNKNILDDKILGNDLTDINALFNIGEENTFVPDKVKGYWINNEVKFTPDKTDYTLTLKYIPTTKKPTIEGVNVRMIAKDEVIGEKELLGFVKATDLTGKDITDKVTVSPKTLDTSTGEVKKVTYTVTDKYGNTSVVDIDIPVAIDWFKYPIGNGWILGDFEYDGNKVTGFSASGKEKVKTNTDLIVPSFVPRDGALNVNELEKVTSIGDSAFKENQLTSVKIPDSVTNIGSVAFAGNRLTSVKMPDSVTNIENVAFAKNKLTSVIIGNSVANIGEGAFTDNKLTSVVIPDSVKSIDNWVFYQNELTSVIIGNSVTSIGKEAFFGNQLEEVVIPDSVTTIGEGAFFDNLLKKVHIGDGVTEIGSAAFRGYYYSKNGEFYIGIGKNPGNQIKELYIGKSVKKIGDYAFAFNQLTNVVIGNSVTSIGNDAFRDNKLTSVVIGNSVTSIGYLAFAYNKLTNVVIGNSVISISDNAFAFNQLTNVTIPNSVTSIGDSAFQNNKLTNVVIGNGVKSIDYYAFNGNQLTNVVIPDSVTSIGHGAFKNNKLENVTIGNSVTSIGNYAFSSNQLTEIVIPDSVTTIGEGAFFDNLLKKVHVGDGVTEIGTAAFQGYGDSSKDSYSHKGKNPGNQIDDLYIGKFVKEIGDSAFINNILTSVVIPDNVETIGSGAFGNNKLVDIAIGTSLVRINGSSFEDNQLKEVVIPDSVKIIGSNAFSHNSLTQVTMGNSVKTIADHAFYDNQLTQVIIPYSVTYINDIAFDYNPGMDKDHNVYLFTPSRTNPNNLESVPGQYLINPTELKLNFVDENGHNICQSSQSVASSGSIFNLPDILGYKADTVKETGEKITDNKFTFVSSISSGIVERTIIYKKADIKVVDGIKLDTSLLKSTNKGPYNYYIGDEQRLDIKLSVLKNIPNIGNATIIVVLPKEVDRSSIKVPAHYNIKDYKIEQNKLLINLKNITRNNHLEIPILFKLKKYETPENKDLTIKTTMKDDRGNYIYKVLENTFTGFYKQPSLYVLADNSHGYEKSHKWQDGHRAVGEFETINKDTSKTRVKTPYNFEYGFDVDDLERNVESYQVEVDVPNYIGLDDKGNEKTIEAVFKEDLNKGWTREGNKLVYTKDSLNTRNPEMPTLILSFPQAKNGSEINLSADITFRPKNKAEKEDLIKVNDNIRIYATGNVLSGNGYLKVYPEGMRYDWKTGNYVYDNSIDRNKEVSWDVYTDYFNKEKEVKNLEIKVEGLKDIDSLSDKYNIDSIELKGDKKLSFNLYNKGKLVDSFILNEENRLHKVSSDIDSIVAKTDEGDVITDSIGFRINTFVKNPKDKIGEGIIRLNASFKSLAKGGNQEVSASNSVKILPFDYELKARIENSDTNKSYVASDIVKFNVGLEDVVNEKHNHQEFLTEDLNNFKELVLLPKNALIKSVKLSDDFKGSTEAAYEVLDLGSGVTGILFKAKTLNKKTYKVADIEIVTNSAMLDGNHKADVYATWDNPDIAKHREMNSPTNALEAKVTSDSSSFMLASVKSVYSEKYVKDKGRLSYSTISKDGNVEYLLRVSNTSDEPRKDVTMVDILPYKGDKRGSQIDVYLTEDINVPGARVTYTTEKAPTTDSNFTPGFRDGITAVKIEKDAIQPGETFEVNLKGKIDLPDDLQGKIKIAGKLGWNDFLKKDNVTDSFVATDKVSVEYSLPNASIEFVKYGLKKSIFFNSYKKVPLAGAEFTLRDMDGKFIQSAKSDKNGKVVFNDVDVKDYIIKETKAPKGYETGPDKRVSADDFKLMDDKIVASLSEDFVNDAVRYGNLTINRTTRKNKPLAGIEFKITGADEANSKYEKVIKTDAEGKAYLNKIPEGNYKVEEVENNTWVPAEPQFFKIEQTQGDQIDEDQEIKLNFGNNKFKFKLNTVSYNNNEDIPRDLTNINLFNRGFVAGAKFKINNVEYTTDKNGNITLPLETGRCIIVEELEAPNGYILNSGMLMLKPSDDGRLLVLGGKPYNGNRLYFPNKLKEVKGDITLNDVNGDGKALEGAKFMLYKVEGMKETPLGEYTSNQDGKISIKDIKAAGTYKLAEISAPDGYYHDKWEKIITIPDTPKGLEAKTSEEATNLRAQDNYDFYTTDDTSFTREIGYKVTNKKLNVSAYNYEKILSNVDEADIDQYNKEGYKTIKSGTKYSVVKAIPNVKFNLYEGDTLIDTLVTGQDGYVDFKGYVFNENKDYKLIEVEAPEGYKLDKAPVRISISKLKAVDDFDGNININIENKPIKGKIVISNYDAKTRLVLPDQEFTLYDSHGKKVESKVTNEAGLIEFGGLKLGTYTFKETAVKGNYKLDPKEYKVNLSISNLIHLEKVFNKPNTKDVIVNKTNDKGEPLEGVEFSIFKNGKLMYGPVKTNSQGIAVFKDVEIEDGLELRETRSIEGYRLNPNKVELDMNQDKVEAKFTNYKTEQMLPDTGTRGLIPYALVTVALLGIGYTVSRKKKQK